MALSLKTSQDTQAVTDEQIVAGGDKTVSYTIRHLTIGKYREVLAAYTRKVPNKRTHRMEDETDDYGMADALIAHVVKDWTGVEFAGKSVQPTDIVTADGEQMQALFLLDGTRRAALLEKAGLNEIKAAEANRADSFRPPDASR